MVQRDWAFGAERSAVMGRTGRDPARYRVEHLPLTSLPRVGHIGRDAQWCVTSLLVSPLVSSVFPPRPSFLSSCIILQTTRLQTRHGQFPVYDVLVFASDCPLFQSFLCVSDIALYGWSASTDFASMDTTTASAFAMEHATSFSP